MTIDLVGRHMELTPELRAYAEAKVKKLGRLVENLDIHVTLDSEKHRKTCGIVARGNGTTHSGEVTNEDLRNAINGAVDILARQLRKSKTSHLARRRSGAASIRHGDGLAAPEPDLEAEIEAEGETEGEDEMEV
jgi:putative sigma-54 modulation protein